MWQTGSVNFNNTKTMDKTKLTTVIAYGGLVLVLVAMGIAFLVTPSGDTVLDVLEDDCSNKIVASTLLLIGIGAVYVAYRMRYDDNE